MQLRNTPTLEELLQESENTKSLCSLNTSSDSVSQSNLSSATKDSLLLSPAPPRQGNEALSLLPVASTMCSAFFTSDVISQQISHEGCLVDQRDNRQGSRPSPLDGVSHPSPSSGYVTYDNVENAISIPGTIDAGSESHGLGSSQGVRSIGGFFLHSTSHTIAKMPEIISHPPIDGEELERSGLEPVFCNTFTAEEDIHWSSVQEDSVQCNRLPSEESDNSHVEDTESPHPSTVLDLNNDHMWDRSEDPVSSSDNTGFSDNSDLSGALNAHHCATTELHSRREPTETEPAHGHVDEAKLSEEPYRMSLQALLKKSQEYRRRQRLLRSQARNTKIQQRTQEQARARREEQSLSDKENDESPYQTTGTAEEKKSKERRDTIETEEPSLKKSWEDERMIDSLMKKTGAKLESTHLIEDGNTEGNVEEETTFRNNKLNTSYELMAEPKQFLQQQPASTEASLVRDVVHLHSEQSATSSNSKGLVKYRTIPAPNFCTSPVHCKSKASIRTAEAVVGAKASKGKIVVNTGLDEDLSAGENNLEYQNSRTALQSSVAVMVEGSVTHVSAQIDQLESNLSGLKVLISDLDSQHQTDTNMQSEFSFKGVAQSEQSKNDSDWCDDVDREFDNRQKRQEDTGPESAFSDADDLPLTVQEEEKEDIHFKEDRPKKSLATERVKGKGASQGPLLTKACALHGSSRSLLSAAQHKRIPEAFRSAPHKPPIPSNVPVLSDASNHPVERRNETTAQGHDSSRSPSLNQSYDVDTPSGLWLLDMGTQEKHLTPESGGEGQGGVSKVKRRLLMHTTEDAQETSVDANGGADRLLRPCSSTPTGTTRTGISNIDIFLPSVAQAVLVRIFIEHSIVALTGLSCSAMVRRPREPQQQAGAAETGPCGSGQSPARSTQETRRRTPAGETTASRMCRGY